jgi:Putative prokaryotic signal transducing protein
MYCPQCLANYREGFTECSECQVPLLPGTPPAPPREPEVELVTVLETHDNVALSLAKAALDEAGIQYLVDADEVPWRPGYYSGWMETSPALQGAFRIQVAREDEDEARSVLEPLEYPEPQSGVTSAQHCDADRGEPQTDSSPSRQSAYGLTGRRGIHPLHHLAEVELPRPCSRRNAQLP